LQHPASGSAPPQLPIGTSSAMNVFDEADLRERLNDNDDLVRKVVASFLEDLPRQLAALRSHLAAGNVTGATRQVHTIKGAAAAVGSGQMQDVAFEMEQAGRAGDLRRLSERLADLERVFQLTKEAMERMNACVLAQADRPRYEDTDCRR